NNQGTALFSLKRYQEAVDSFDRALKINPYNSQAWAGKGSALGFLEDYEEAIFCMERFMELAADSRAPQVEESWAMILEWKMKLNRASDE
ncbi:MAG: tetratricopeptide repeat protein, partial [Methanobacteriaceae archaeon]|nr:tetratricopeptide repeat protein [Methanobacteriaceae archaeon]